MNAKLLNNRYELLEKIGDGGMATVYRAQDTVLGRLVAIKILRDQYASDPTFLARFRREAHSAANLSHPNIVNVYDVGTDKGVHFIVMEYVDGANLKDLIVQGAPFQVRRAVEIATQICQALDFAHRKGLVHRDVKPQNILIAQNGLVKVADFGIAKGLSDISMTETGTALGTVHYFSPEQARGSGASPQSDLYSTGVVLYEMLTGRLPFESDSAVGVALKHIEEPPDPPSHYNPQIPPRLESIMLSALAKNPAQRFHSSSEFGEALRNYQEFGQQRTAAVNVSNAPPKTKRVAATAPAMPPPLREARRPVAKPKQATGCTTWMLGLVLLLAILALVPLALWVYPLLAGPSTPPSIPGLGATAAPTSVASDAATPTATPAQSPTPTPKGEAVVPDLVGRTYSEAEADLKQLGLGIEKVGERNDDKIPTGSVVEQTVSPQDKVEQGTAIGVIVSLGKKAVTVPPLVNVSESDAEAALNKLGLQIQKQDKPSADVPAGVVIEQSPEAGQEVTAGDTVTLVVSIGNKVKMPDVFGLPVEGAVSQITGAGLKVVSINYQTQKDLPPGVDINIVKPGQVLSSIPDFNTWVDKGTGVSIAVRAVDKKN